MKLYREFFSYVIPSLLAFALSGVYCIVDGFFVGNSIGDVGLTTINIAYPVVALLQAAGTGIGMGGAVHYSIRLAAGKREEAERYTDGTVLLLLAASLISTLVFYLASPSVLAALGASGHILDLGNSYLRIIVLGSVFQIFGTGLVPLIRNMGGAFYAMMIMVAGFLTNIVLDYAFVWVLHLGVDGAALATLIGQAVTMAGGLLFFLRRGVSFHLLRSVFSSGRSGGLLGGIVKIGLSPFGITFSPNITIILMNRFLMDYGGEKAAACYACIVYVIVIVYLLLQGVGDGCQPLISRYYGEDQAKSMKKVCSLAYLSGVLIAAACMLLIFLTRYQIGGLFGASDQVRAEAGQVLPCFLISLVFLAFVRVTTSAFYATEKTFLSYILVYAEPAFLFLLLLFLPRLAGLTGVWLSIPLAQTLTFVTALACRLWVSSRSSGGTRG